VVLVSIIGKSRDYEIPLLISWFCASSTPLFLSSLKDDGFGKSWSHLKNISKTHLNVKNKSSRSVKIVSASENMALHSNLQTRFIQAWPLKGRAEACYSGTKATRLIFLPAFFAFFLDKKTGIDILTST
jgi:hypothetical protein